MNETAMQSNKPKEIFALLGIILVTLNTRAAISVLSPIFQQIETSFPISAMANGILGMLPPITFAVFGWLTPRVIRKFGLERSCTIAMVILCIGILVRSLSVNAWMFGVLYVVCLAGMGMSNVLLPPLIKQYFPNRIGLLTSMYSSLIPSSIALISLVAVPITQAVGWRFFTAMWAGLPVLAAVPWIKLSHGSQEKQLEEKRQNLPVWRWPMAYTIVAILSVGVINFYVGLAWFPKLLMATAGVSQATAAIMLSAYAAVGGVLALGLPMLLTRSKRIFLVILFMMIMYTAGSIGLAFFPQLAWVWIIGFGFGQSLIPVSLTLVNMKSRTTGGTTSLSGFVQGAGYVMGALGPLVFGGLFNLSGDWISPLWFLVGTAVLAAVAGLIANRTSFVEDMKTLQGN